MSPFCSSVQFSNHYAVNSISLFIRTDIDRSPAVIVVDCQISFWIGARYSSFVLDLHKVGQHNLSIIVVLK